MISISKNIFLILFITLYSCQSSSVIVKEVISECNGQLIKAFQDPKVKSQFPEGNEGMWKFIFENLQYPQEAEKLKINGKIDILFIITKEGDICNIEILSKSKQYLDIEIIRVLRLMPKWIPAIYNGETVNSYYLLRINFNKNK